MWARWLAFNSEAELQRGHIAPGQSDVSRAEADAGHQPPRKVVLARPVAFWAEGLVAESLRC